MNHNYKLADFNILTEIDTELQERIVSIDLSNIKELPVIVMQRLENLLNKMITDYEQEHNVTIPLENMNVGVGLSIDTKDKEFYLSAYIGYDINEECIVGKEVITSDNEDYAVIKKYYLTELNHFVFIQLRKIEACA